MSDQQDHTQAPPEGSPETGEHQAPATNWDADDNPYVGRYRETQAWGTRKSQEAADLQRTLDAIRAQDPDTLRELGLEFVTDDQPAPDEDVYDSRITQLEQANRDREQAAREAAQLEELRSYVDGQLDAIDGLDQGDRDLVIRYALDLPPTTEGRPDIRAAHAALVARDEAAQQRWASTKRTQRAPVGGQAATHVPDLGNESQRRAEMAERFSALDD